MKISIVIPSYNSENVLKKNIPNVVSSIEEFSDNCEIIIRDDFSTDDSVKVIKELVEKNKKTKIKLFISNRNQGFSSNVNNAVKEAAGEIVILLNTDVSPSKNFIAPLLKHFDDENVFAVGCLDESLEDGKIVKRGRGKGKWIRGFMLHSAADIDSTDMSTLWVSGGSGAFKKSIWEKLGGLDEIYNPFYWEDIDLSYRALKSGYKIIFEKNSTVRHEHEEGVIKKKFKSKKVNDIVYRNQFIFAWKNSDLINLLKSIIWLPYHLFNSLLSRNSSMLIGFFCAVRRAPSIIKSRRINSKIFVLSDNEVIAKIN